MASRFIATLTIGATQHRHGVQQLDGDPFSGVVRLMEWARGKVAAEGKCPMEGESFHLSIERMKPPPESIPASALRDLLDEARGEHDAGAWRVVYGVQALLDGRDPDA